MKNIKLFSIITISFLCFACGEDYDETITESGIETEEIIISEQETGALEFVFPSPMQIARIFNKSGVTYIEDLTNLVENENNYNTKYSQQLNYGVYSADMAYCMINNQTQKSISYLSTLSRLSEKIGMSEIITPSGLKEKLENSTGNNDSLAFIMADMQMKMDNYISENKLNNSSIIIFTGAWIETLYIGTIINEKKRNEKLISRLAEQEMILEGLISSFKQNNTTNEHTYLLTALEDLDKTFKNAKVEVDEELFFSDEALKILGEQVKTIRTNIVENK